MMSNEWKNPVAVAAVAVFVLTPQIATHNQIRLNERPVTGTRNYDSRLKPADSYATATSEKRVESAVNFSGLAAPEVQQTSASSDQTLEMQAALLALDARSLSPSRAVWLRNAIYGIASGVALRLPQSRRLTDEQSADLARFLLENDGFDDGEESRV